MSIELRRRQRLKMLMGHGPYQIRRPRQMYRLPYRRRAEAALGKPLPPRAVVHHHSYYPEMLVICQDQGYHSLLEMRARIVRRGGDPNTDAWCSACKAVKPQTEFWKRATRTATSHVGARTTVCRSCCARNSRVVVDRRKKLNPDAIRDIRKRLAAGQSKNSIAPQFNVSRRTIQQIASGYLWRDVL